jgi:hypothetical protein
MKNKRLRVIPPTNKKVPIFKPEDCLNYLEPNRRLFLRNSFLSEGPLPEAKNGDHDFRERYRI